VPAIEAARLLPKRNAVRKGLGIDGKRPLMDIAPICA